MTQKYAERIIAIAWIVSLVGIIAALLRPYMNQVIDTGVLLNYMSWQFPGMLYFDYAIKASILTYMLYMKSRLGAILILFVFLSDKSFMLISLHGFDTIYIYTWLIAQSIYGLIFMMAIWAAFAHRHRIAADLPDEGTVATDLKLLWKGKMHLYRAFWAYVGGGILATIVINGLSYLLGVASLLLSIAILFMFLPVACIGTWRCAGNYTGKRIWAVLYRLGVLLVVLYIIFIIYGTYAMFSSSSSVMSNHDTRNAELGTWEDTLEARDFDDNTSTIEGYYDTALDITWLADANYAVANSDVADGRMTWSEAKSWVDRLDISGTSDWRLPNLRPINGVTFDVIHSNNATTDNGYAYTTTDGTDGGWRDSAGNPASEMGYMFYVSLGKFGSCSPDHSDRCVELPRSGPFNTGPFSNVQHSAYWINPSTDFNPDFVCAFLFGSGEQVFSNDIDGVAFAWAVHDGDVGIPIIRSSTSTE